MKEALAGTGAHLAAEGPDVVVVSPHDEEQMERQVTAEQLSAALGVATGGGRRASTTTA